MRNICEIGDITQEKGTLFHFVCLIVSYSLTTVSTVVLKPQM